MQNLLLIPVPEGSMLHVSPTNLSPTNYHLLLLATKKTTLKTRAIQKSLSLVEQ